MGAPPPAERAGVPIIGVTFENGRRIVTLASSEGYTPIDSVKSHWNRKVQVNCINQGAQPVSKPQV